MGKPPADCSIACQNSVPSDAIAALRRPSVTGWLRRALWEWFLLLVAFATARAVDHWAVYVLAVLVIGTRQHALAILGHEGAHHLICRSRRWNDLLTGFFCFWPLGIGLKGYRKHHFAHHRRTGMSPDPELEYKRWGAPNWDLPMPRRWFGINLLSDVLGLGIRELVNVMRVSPPIGWRDLIGPLGWWIAVGAVLYLTGAYEVPVMWVAGLVTTFWAMFRLRIWTEHQGTGGAHRIKASWWQRWLFLPHNTWCHYEHHRWPSIPCGNLAAARRLDPSVPVLTVAELFESYSESPHVASGTPLNGAAGEVAGPQDTGTVTATSKP